MLGGISDRWRRGGDAAPAPTMVNGAGNKAAVAIASPQPVIEKPPEDVLQRPKLIDEKVKLHGRIIDEFNLNMLEGMPPDELRRQVKAFVMEYVKTERVVLNQKELESFSEEVLHEMTGLGPLEPLLADPTINDILINGYKHVYVERRGVLEPTTVRFADEPHLLRIINKIVAGVGRRVDESSPICDARLPDGSRVNIAVRPIAIDGPQVSIRKFSKRPFSLDRLVDIGACRPQIADVLKVAVKGRISLVVSGGTGSGKTTMLNALSSFISPRERLVTIEDAAELQLQQDLVSRLETRPPNAEGKGEIRQREMVKNALRMRPDRIIIGECRGDEAFDMLQAMNTGHEGSMTTVHANNPRDGLKRLEQMVGMADMPMSINSIRGRIAAAIQVVVQLSRLPDGQRKLTSVSEVTGMEGDIIQMQEIFKYQREGYDADGKIVGSFRGTGVRPKLLTDLKAHGYDIPASYFDPNVV